MSLGLASRYSGIPKASLWRYEKGISRVPAEYIAKLAKLYGVEVTWLLEGDSNNA